MIQKHFSRFVFVAFLVVFAGLVAALAPLVALAQSSVPRAETWVPNAPVNAMVVAENKVFIGGGFDYVGPCTGAWVPIDASSGKAPASFPKVNGMVWACAGDGSGGWFVGGYFTRVGGVARSCLAHILADGTVDPAWNPGANFYVYALVRFGNVLYAGGSFQVIGGQGRGGIAALDTATGVPTAWNPYAYKKGVIIDSGTVYALAVSASGNTVYAGGDFTSMSARTRYYAAALDAGSGLTTEWNPGADHPVRALAASGATVYAGGEFTKIGEATRNHIAALDAFSGAPSDWNPNADGTVYSFALSGSTLYVGGLFTRISGFARNHLAALGLSSGLATPWNPDVQGPSATFVSVESLAISGSTLYAGGQFNSIGGQLRSRLAALDLGSGSPLDWNPAAGGIVLALGVSGQTVCAGGNFSSIGGITRRGLAAIDTSSGLPTAWDPNTSGSAGTGIFGSGRNGTVYSLVLSGSTLYAGGTFTGMGLQPRNNLAAVDISTGLPTSWNPDVRRGTSLPDVNSLTVSGQTVYAAGGFSSVGGLTRNNIAAIDAGTGLPTSWNPDANGYVWALAVSGSTVYAGGGFTSIGLQTRNCIGALDAETGLATNWNPNSEGLVKTMLLSGPAENPILYVGGSFTRIGGQMRGYLAALDLDTGLPTSWSPSCSGYNVTALAFSSSPDGGILYVGGDFQSLGGKNRLWAGGVDCVSAHANAWNPKASYVGGLAGVNALAVVGPANATSPYYRTVFAGGSFTVIGGEPNSYFAQFDPVPLGAKEWAGYR